MEPAIGIQEVDELFDLGGMAIRPVWLRKHIVNDANAVRLHQLEGLIKKAVLT